jgi:hypothetical protein
MIRTTHVLVLLISATATPAEIPPPAAADCPAHASHTAQLADHFAQVTTRGDRAMGFSHQSTEHHFRLTQTGGAIAVSAKDPLDLASTEAIRGHLAHVARAFALGDFALPGEIHGRIPPGVSGMKRWRAAIRYVFTPTAQGGSVVITTDDAKALKAVHAFLRFQIADHQTGDAISVEP